MPLTDFQTTWDADVLGADPLSFPGYSPPGEESVITGRTAHYALIEGRFDVLGGSMGAAHGERVVRAYRRALDERLPVVVVASSGGARMQEGMVSLVQMARTTAAATAHANAGLLQVALLRSPTTGGVYASYASLADLKAAEPGATLGFAGPRVVELTTGERLPPKAHTAESAHAAGLIDAVVARDEQLAWVEAALGLRDLPLPSRPLPPPEPVPVTEDPYGEVLLARRVGRPTGLDHAAAMCSSWIELASTDPVVRAGLATVDGRRVVLIAMDRYAADGHPRPAGYRLAQRAVRLADRLGLPVVTLVDTPGADPRHESEQDGVAGEIARTFAAMASLRTVSVAVCVGEGGSGGALALAAADRLLIQEHAVFSVIAPEGAAAILTRDTADAPRIATQLRLTAPDLLELCIVDAVIRETDGALRAAVVRALDEAAPGDRERRFDEATARWIRS